MALGHRDTLSLSVGRESWVLPEPPLHADSCHAMMVGV
jgi:hypothetical protein